MMSKGTLTRLIEKNLKDASDHAEKSALRFSQTAGSEDSEGASQAYLAVAQLGKLLLELDPS